MRSALPRRWAASCRFPLESRLDPSGIATDRYVKVDDCVWSFTWIHDIVLPMTDSPCAQRPTAAAAAPANGEPFPLSSCFICAALLRAIPPARARTRLARGEANTIHPRRHAVQGSLRLSVALFESFSHALAAAFRRAECVDTGPQT